MRIMGMGLPELLILLGIVIVLFGPKFLPKIGSGLGKAVKNLRTGMHEGERGNDASVAVQPVDEDDEEPSARPRADAGEVSERSGTQPVPQTVHQA